MDPDTFNTALLYGGTAIAAVTGLFTANLFSKAVNPKIKDPSLTNFITWSEVLQDETTIKNIDGSCFRIIHVEGTIYSNLKETVVSSIQDKRRQWILSLKERGVKLRFYSPHRSASVPATKLGEGVVGEINRTWADYMRHTFSTSHYIVLYVSKEINVNYLEIACYEAKTYLSEHNPKILTNEPDRDNNSPLLSFLYYLLNGRSGFVQPVKNDITTALTSTFIETNLDEVASCQNSVDTAPVDTVFDTTQCDYRNDNPTTYQRGQLVWIYKSLHYRLSNRVG